MEEEVGCGGGGVCLRRGSVSFTLRRSGLYHRNSVTDSTMLRRGLLCFFFALREEGGRYCFSYPPPLALNPSLLALTSLFVVRTSLWELRGVRYTRVHTRTCEKSVLGSFFITQKFVCTFRGGKILKNKYKV